MTLRTIIAAAALLAAGLLAAEPGATTRPAATAPAADPACMKILRRLEAAGRKFPRIAAAVQYRVDMLQAGDREDRAGKVYYQAAEGGRPAMFRIHFDTLQQDGGPRMKNVVDYAFDGTWLTVRKERLKQLTRYRVPAQTDPVQLGKGPFPVPFGQKARTVLERFSASTRPPRASDPPKSDYLKLLTRKAYRRELKLKWVEMWVERGRDLPVKIVAEDRSENRSTVVFTKIETPAKFPDKTFTLPDPPRGWDVRVERFQGRVK